MSNIINKIANIKTINVINIFRKNESTVYNLLVVNKNKSKLDITETFSFKDYNSLMLSLNRKIPLIILMDGKGVLNKKIDIKNEIDVEWIKNLDYDTIHYLSYNTSNFQFLSFCRKNVADEILLDFNKSGFQVIDFYIGCLPSVLLIDNLKKSKIFSNESVLYFENDELIEILKNDNEEKSYDIGNSTISNFQLPLYGAVINFYVKHTSIVKSSSALVNYEEIIYKKAFQKFGLSMIIIFFMLLLTSYSLIQYYNSRNSQLNSEYMYSGQSYKIYEKLEKQKNNKLKIINETGITSSKFISFFSYELASSIPSQVNLSVIDVFPLQKDIKLSKKIQFNSNEILVKGFTSNESIFNSWLEKFRDSEWINKLEIISIKKDKNNISYFELKISIKNV